MAMKPWACRVGWHRWTWRIVSDGEGGQRETTPTCQRCGATR